MNEDYDIGKAFARIEDELIASMIRNMRRHKVEEVKEEKQWSMWQVEQLARLDEYKRRNAKKYPGKFRDINEKIETMIKMAKSEGEMDQEVEILEAIKNGYQTIRNTPGGYGEFFHINDDKLDALINATTNDMQKAEVAILRRANDQYRKAIFDAAVYANTGAGTYEKAVDMATHDMLAAGLTCVEYKNGAKHTLEDYADMALRTANKRAYLQGEGAKRQEYGVYTVMISPRGGGCPKCLPFIGKVMIDDVWGGGPSDGKSPTTGVHYPLLSSAIAAGLYHPRCKDSHSTYFEGINTPPDDSPYTKEELDALAEKNKAEARRQYAERQEKKYERMGKYSLDPENQELYKSKAKQWRGVRFKTGNMSTKQYAESKRPLASFRATPQDEVVNLLRQDTEEWIATLSEDEVTAIQKYTYNAGTEEAGKFYEQINAMLRGETPENPMLRKYADIISGALKKDKLKRDVICYRVLDKDVYASYKKGDIFRTRQFISTSVTARGALKGEFKVNIYAPKGTCGAYIEKISKFPKQRELLLDKGTVFRVISKRENEIDLEVIP